MNEPLTPVSVSRSADAVLGLQAALCARLQVSRLPGKRKAFSAWLQILSLLVVHVAGCDDRHMCAWLNKVPFPFSYVIELKG